MKDARRENDPLALQNQLCFPFYAISRKIIQAYTPLLKPLDLTYPQYLCMLVLWQDDEQTVGQLCYRLFLDTNTLSPLVRKLEAKGLITQKRPVSDRRRVHLYLTDKGKALRQMAEGIPGALIEQLESSPDQLEKIREQMWAFAEELRD